jgi:glycosyltransferase involved in cell wall biosynthesis
MKPLLTIGIIAGNEEKMIKDCLLSCSWAERIILVAANSTDNTVNIAKSTVPKIKIYHTTDQYNKNFSKWRNIVYKNTDTPWLLYIDADERITPQLKSEITKILSSSKPSVYYVIPRANYFLGKRVKYGGTYPDYVKRLYQMQYFKGYTGYLHEEPIINGDFNYLKSDLLHYTHRNLSSMLSKSLVWTDSSAQALYQSNHPPVVWWRLIRMMLTKIWQRLIIGQMWRDGTVGWISVIFETFDTFMIYARLWEIQQKQK